VMTIPTIISRSDVTSPAIAAGLLRTRTSSHTMPRVIERTGSAAVMIACTGARNVPCWKAS